MWGRLRECGRGIDFSLRRVRAVSLPILLQGIRSACYRMRFRCHSSSGTNIIWDCWFCQSAFAECHIQNSFIPRLYLPKRSLANVEESTRGVSLISYWACPMRICHRVLIFRTSGADLYEASFSTVQQHGRNLELSDEKGYKALKLI